LSADYIAVGVAVVALCVSLAQWAVAGHAGRIKLLLGEKESVGFQALQIAKRPNRRVPDDEIRALVLATLLESSDRARVQVYRALETLRRRHERQIVAFRYELGASADAYRKILDLDRYDRRVRQLDAALPWIVSDSALKQGATRDSEAGVPTPTEL
jgi:hypothetical protein